METFKVKKPKEISWDYDDEADTLYVSFGKPVEALTLDLGSGVLLRYKEKTNEVVGFTLIGVRAVLGLKKAA